MAEVERPLTERRNLQLREATLVGALATTDRLSELLPFLHYQAISAVSGRSSVLLRLDTQRRILYPISSFRTMPLPSVEWPLDAVPLPPLSNGQGGFVAEIGRSMFAMNDYLQSEAAVLVPLLKIDELRGLLVVSADGPPGEKQLNEVGSVGHAFVLALERNREEGETELEEMSRFEAERAELRSRLVQSEKLAALGQLVAGIAHELNNPLQGVLGHLELLREGGTLTRSMRRDMQMVYREADRAAKIVKNLLAFSGSRRLIRRRTSVNAVLTRVLALRAPAMRAAGIELIRTLGQGLPRVKSDPLLVHQALLNIVLNAEQAIGGSGGRIEARTAINRTANRTRFVIEIRDTGPGIAPEVLPRIFEPFYTTKEIGKGTGLGLAIAYGIVREHGGEILVSNHPQGGAVFAVQLPLETE